MKLIAPEQGRVLDLVPIEELRSTNGVFLPDFIKQIVERYKFVAWPTDLKDAATNGAKFEHGTTIVDGDSVVIKELGIYSDGLILDTFDTRTTTVVLDEFLQWAKETFKLRERQTKPHRTYTSVIIFEFETDVESALGKINEITKFMSEAVSSAYGWSYEFNLQRLAFTVDPATLPHFRQTQFFIERRVGTPYSDNRYYSGAPLPTEQHIRLLETIEKTILK